VGSMIKVMRKLAAGGAADATAAASRFRPDGGTTASAPAAPATVCAPETVAWEPKQVDPALAAFHQRHSAVCEQYRGLRARLLAMNPAHSPQVIAITSAVPEEGKSVSAANLALVMAEGGEHRVLLVDADFRRGRLARMLGVPSSPGLADVLRREAPLEAACQASPLGNLRVLPAGGGVDGGHSVIGRWTALVAEIRAAFDYAFLDMPPVTTVSDASLLAPQCDGVIIVVLMRRTPEPTVQQAVRTLQANHVNVLGAILSRFDERGPGYYDYYAGTE
jgi:capsular exopolysaccharide synthesis family protein